MTVLITGGAGYIGAHVLAALESRGDKAVVVDDLTTGTPEKVGATPHFNFDISTTGAADALADIMQALEVTSVVHFAAKKQVGESVAKPAWYYQQNMGGLANVLEAMQRANVKSLVFSSSAAVYGLGTGSDEPIREDDVKDPINPYGQTKLAGEWLVQAAAKAAGISAVSLRYFNVAGAGSDELADRFALNLVPMIFEKLAEGKSPLVFGDDYPTPDGTCVRDYVHVVDLADAHLAVLDAIAAGTPVSTEYNVGRGEGYSVFEVVDAVRRASGQKFEAEVAPRRPGDPALLVADASRIKDELGWTAKFSLDDMVTSAWSGFERNGAPVKA